MLVVREVTKWLVGRLAIDDAGAAGRFSSGIGRDEVGRDGGMLMFACNGCCWLLLGEGIAAGSVTIDVLAREFCESGCRAVCRHLAMAALVPLVIRWRDERCRRRTSVGRRTSCDTEQRVMSKGAEDDNEPRDEWVVFGIFNTELETKHWFMYLYFYY